MNFPLAFSEKTSDDAEREFVAVALEMLPSRSVIDAEPQVSALEKAREDPGKNGMGGPGDDDMGLVRDIAGAVLRTASCRF